eukprot:TRINITY_DN57091_c0_g1_i1.p1 TRINITY_DN57091_c0_g1~~TRINITY_DN57091_c0_g1_i1.p1  ORF type:complete len:559 (-),score=77.56 TRINITY_DN57091_c0_g1_i1:94-1659(-)
MARRVDFLDARTDPFKQAMEKVQMYVFPRRIRIREFFHDFDNLRSGRCTLAQFARALKLSGVELSPSETDALADLYCCEPASARSNNVQSETLQAICYDKFCEEVDIVFVKGSPRNLGQPKALWPVRSHLPIAPPCVAVDSGIEWQAVGKVSASSSRFHCTQEEAHLLQRISVLCKTRGVVLKTCFQDFDRSPRAGTRVTARLGGKVTVNQFERLFPFKKECSQGEIDLLVERYRTEGGDVSYMALHDDVMEAMPTELPPCARSDMTPRADDTRWCHDTLASVDKIRAKVVERRTRLHDHFRDFDVLRKGVCTVGQVKTAFTILNIWKDIDRKDFENLVAQFTREDGMFSYVEFCAYVDQAFGVPGLEKKPLEQSSMPSPETTAPARRNRMRLAPEVIRQTHSVEKEIQHRIATRRIDIRPVFRDLDKTRTGHVTRTQFTRAMSSLGCDLDEPTMDLLANIYCDMGNRSDFNYLEFCAIIDPIPADTVAAHRALVAPVPPQSPPKYFNARGALRPRATAVA